MSDDDEKCDSMWLEHHQPNTASGTIDRAVDRFKIVSDGLHSAMGELFSEQHVRIRAIYGAVGGGYGDLVRAQQLPMDGATVSQCDTLERAVNDAAHALEMFKVDVELELEGNEQPNEWIQHMMSFMLTDVTQSRAEVEKLRVLVKRYQYQQKRSPGASAVGGVNRDALNQPALQPASAAAGNTRTAAVAPSPAQSRSRGSVGTRKRLPLFRKRSSGRTSGGVVPGGRPKHTLAVVAMVLNVMMFPFGGLLSIPLGHKALRRIKLNPQWGGRRLAMWSILLGWAGLIFAAVAWFISITNFGVPQYDSCKELRQDYPNGVLSSSVTGAVAQANGAVVDGAVFAKNESLHKGKKQPVVLCAPKRS